jgi:hypothetical protein
MKIMPLKYREEKKIRLRHMSHFKKPNHKIDLDLRDINKNLDIENIEINRPVDLEKVFLNIKQKFALLVSPFVSGEYKREKKDMLIFDKTDKTIKLRYQLMSLSDHIGEFIFQLRMYVITHSDDKDKIEEIEKEIKEWEKILNHVLNDLIDKVNFVIQNYFVPICERLEKNNKKVKI